MENSYYLVSLEVEENFLIVISFAHLFHLFILGAIVEKLKKKNNTKLQFLSYEVKGVSITA